MDDNNNRDRDEGLGTAVKKLLTAGVGAAFLTEESIRSYVSDLKLPKDVMKLLLQSAQKSKEEITSRVGKEILEMLDKVDWANEVEKFLKTHRIKINLELEVENRAESKVSASAENSNTDS